MNSWNKIKKYTLVASILGFALIGLSTELTDDFEVAKNLEIFSNVYAELNTYYVDELDPEKVMRTGLDAMLRSLDPYTIFYSPEEVAQFESSITGEYGGVGTTVIKVKDKVVITEPYEGGPAHEAGLKPGDIVTKIEGKAIDKMTTSEVSRLMRGKPETSVKIEVKRAKKTLNFELERAKIHVPNLPYYKVLDNDIAYIMLSTFSRDAGKHVSDALMELKAKSPLKGVILDLRGNTGGLLTEAVNVANVFLPKGELVVQVKGRDKSKDRSFNTLNQAVDTEIPLAVLIDGRSASASEIVAGSIQDLDRGVVIGQRSFGKGLVQNTRSISFGAKVKLTTARYYIPSGRCIQSTKYKNGKPVKLADSLREAYKTKGGRTVYDGGGITPDIKIEHKDLDKVLATLNREYLIFDYSVDYMRRHKSIPEGKQFKLTDADFDDFIAFLEKRSYQYDTQTEKEIESLEKIAKKEDYINLIGDDIKALRQSISESKQENIAKNKRELLHILQKLIARHYYYKKGFVEAGLNTDVELKKAKQTLLNTDAYSRILKKN